MNVVSSADRQALARVMMHRWAPPADVVTAVAGILADVAAHGDAAVVDYTRRFDDPAFEKSRLRVPVPTPEQAASLVPREVREAFDLAKDRIARFHERQRQADLSYAEEDGTRYRFARRPLEAVAAYAPCDDAALASTVLMSAIPAKLAGVSRVAVFSPPKRHGAPDPAVIYACALCGVDELWAAGGAQAIGAAAYGTESIAPFDKIVGPGNVWVTEAKRQVFGTCGIDGLAGPAEVLIVADDGANSEFVAGELLATAEHSGAARLAVVSESRPLLEAVAQLLDTLELRTLERGQTIAEAIEERCCLIHAPTRDDVFDTIERFAPGTLCLQVRDPSAYVGRIRRAGAVFAGDMTPLACGDYLAGSNAIVPTAGTARFASALCLNDFTRTFGLVENSVERMMNDAQQLAAIADAEGLPQHAQTARMRYGG